MSRDWLIHSPSAAARTKPPFCRKRCICDILIGRSRVTVPWRNVLVVGMDTIIYSSSHVLAVVHVRASPGGAHQKLHVRTIQIHNYVPVPVPNCRPKNKKGTKSNKLPCNCVRKCTHPSTARRKLCTFALLIIIIWQTFKLVVSLWYLPYQLQLQRNLPAYLPNCWNPSEHRHHCHAQLNPTFYFIKTKRSEAISTTQHNPRSNHYCFYFTNHQNKTKENKRKQKKQPINQS